MTDREKKAIIEGILFLWGDPIPVQEIAKALECPVNDCRRLLSEMQEEMEHERRGLMLRSYDDQFQLTTRPEHNEYFSRLIPVRDPGRMTNSTMETLAIISYKQPVTRIEIDAIRGVQSTSPVETLLSRGLIEEAGRLEQIGRPILYRTTTKFLQTFGLKTLKDLPEAQKIEELLQLEDADADQ
ncbi:MAG: SMC-Scp complex subunit ScpB [Peptoniphilaceae bacterium]|nr:SMC-Scp complex subunit ScpB [Peptoniphilaceae bacterium]MDD7434750.1 SMC-Scp complex subunit ScpB [Peptoniphilaceae bacterium]MDY3075763.1 SMC-Scp complex subunit ScpB [Peptoniphilaceae bacterium]MDY4195818.1 SMC-Scp complex subunit ScpB [Peptoniphilaceae bacterium]MDY6146335.1 SMC-Scp complex subunit ScpB [Peptoniphilaceae bacterium]